MERITATSGTRQYRLTYSQDGEDGFDYFWYSDQKDFPISYDGGESVEEAIRAMKKRGFEVR